ncbi:hypothetical protein SAMN04487947_0963 [Halogeometricum rufum]|uniref:Uncharacterized protein n=1 Tax=Halogeometricum rufum TaxID=553469 RepID=A0A1I6GDN1_9EURY|nr:hypothetical protein [Halogeometricum rufum]SFR40231.1 hypothetical protein SAMN04487947_0963 [Halogeometricum rufum]
MSVVLQSLQSVAAFRSIPLFPGLPGGPELLVLFLILVLVGIAPALFVYYDAKRNRVPNRLAWTAATFLAGLVGNLVGAGIVLVLYLVVARR